MLVVNGVVMVGGGGMLVVNGVVMVGVMRLWE